MTKTVLGKLALLVVLAWLGFAVAEPARAGQDPEKAQFYSDVQDKKVPLDHTATIGKFQYEIYIRKGTATYVASIISRKGFDALMGMPLKQRHKVMEDQNKLVDQYMSTITGVPPDPPQQAKPMGYLRAHPNGGAAEHAPFEAPAGGDGDIYNGCPENFSQKLKGEHILTDSNVVGIEYWGRPYSSTVVWLGGNGPIGEERQPYCQLKVGKMSGRQSDQGGHTVARMLGGWGGRANLTPQHTAINHKIFTRIDSAVDFCIRTNKLINSWEVISGYAQFVATDIRPIWYAQYYDTSVQTCPPQWKQGPYLWPQPSNEFPTSELIAAVYEWTNEMRTFCSARQANFKVQDNPCD